MRIVYSGRGRVGGELTVDDLKVELGAVKVFRAGTFDVERTVRHHLILTEVPSPDGTVRFTVHVTHGTLIIEPNASNAVVLRVENLR